MKIGLAADIGGTFTDIVAERDGRRWSTKVLTTHAAPEHALLEGVDIVLEQMSARYEDVSAFVHGTTLATNAIIERKGAKTALLATEGFRDVIEIADESRYDQYDLNLEKKPPLVPRALRLTIPERVDVTGAVLLPLDETVVRAAAARCREAEIASVAVAFIHAYANPDHEARVREIFSEAAPDIAVSLSSEVCPEVREFERTTTTIANAYVQPLVAGYVRRLEAAMTARGCRASLRLMTSGGALANVDAACRFPRSACGIGTGGRRHSRRGPRRRPRGGAGARLRHGRHHREDLVDRKRPPLDGPHLRGRSQRAVLEGQRHAGSDPGAGDDRNRRRGRIDRIARRDPVNRRRARKRRVGTRARLLRPRRRCANGDGRRRRSLAALRPNALRAARSR